MSLRKDALFGAQTSFGRFLDSEDTEVLQAFLERCADYFELVCGGPPGPSEAADLFANLPGGKTREDKLVVGVFEIPERLIGVFDVVRDYREPGEWHLGLMLLEPERRDRGLGGRLYRAFERWAKKSGARAIRLGVVEESERARRFWQRMGFEEVDRTPPRRFGERERVLIVMRRSLNV